MRRSIIKWGGLIALLGLLGVGLYFLPPIHQRLAWRVAALNSRVFYFLHPPDQKVFVPQKLAPQVQATLAALSLPAATASQTPVVPPDLTASQPAPVETAAATLVPTPAPTAIAGKTLLTGIHYQYQSFNNCGPANLAMALSYWGWKGDQRDTKAALRPNDDDANVMPEELAAFAGSQPGLKALIRVGGSLELLKQLVAAGFPPIIEMGHHPGNDWWMGHYVVVSGYDDATARLTTQDSLIMPDLPLPYKEIEAKGWRDFNRIYIVIYPPERESEVLAILGPDADPAANLSRALELQTAEIPTLTGRDLFFALYNQGDDLLAQQDYIGAADAYDLAFGIYEAISEKQRPWRVTWYRPGPYQAYYQVGRYQDVIHLADSTLSMLSKRGLEESHYWRGLAYEALGDRDKAIFDYQIALRLRPAYPEVQEALARLGSGG